MEESFTMIDSKEKFILEILEEQIEMLSAVSKNNGFKCNCHSAWIWHTLQIMNVDARYFQNSIISTLRYGQLKRFNLLLVGSSTAAKSFLLQPLGEIYNCMIDLATKTYMVVSVRKERVFFQIFDILKSSCQGKNFETYLMVPP